MLARPAEKAVPLTADARGELRAMLPTAMRRAKVELPKVAMTIEQARHYAEVSPRMTWQAEYCGWFVFGFKGWKGGPDRWSGVIFVEKGTNRVGCYREVW